MEPLTSVLRKAVEEDVPLFVILPRQKNLGISIGISCAVFFSHMIDDRVRSQVNP